MQGLVQAFGFCYVVHSSYYPEAMALPSFVVYLHGPSRNGAASVRIGGLWVPIPGGRGHGFEGSLLQRSNCCCLTAAADLMQLKSQARFSASAKCR